MTKRRKKHTEVECKLVNKDATGRVKPSNSMGTMHRSVPNNMYGLRRPKREVELSAKMPGPHPKVSMKTTAKELNALLADEWLHDET